MVSKLSKLLADLPEPPKENLTSHFILGEIISHIHVLQEEFPHVDIPRLRSHLWNIRNKSVEPENHLRGFLKVFEKTDVFKNAFEELDDGLKRQLKVFMSTEAGSSEGPVMASGRQHGVFHLPPSPPVKRHFSEMTAEVEKFFHVKPRTNGHVNGIHNDQCMGCSEVPTPGTTDDGNRPDQCMGCAKKLVDGVHTDQCMGCLLKQNGVQANQGMGCSLVDSPGHNPNQCMGCLLKKNGVQADQCMGCLLKQNGVQADQGMGCSLVDSPGHNPDQCMGCLLKKNGVQADQCMGCLLKKNDVKADQCMGCILPPTGDSIHKNATEKDGQCMGCGRKKVVVHDNQCMGCILPSNGHDIQKDATEKDDQCMGCGRKKVVVHDDQCMGCILPSTNGHDIQRNATEKDDQCMGCSRKKVAVHDDQCMGCRDGVEPPRIFEDEAETKIMEVYYNKNFQNWGQSVSNTPLWTFVPKAVLGLQNLVKWAKINDFRVRCSGYRHSWSSTFSAEKQILVSLLNLEEVTRLPDAMSIKGEHIDPTNELKSIELKNPPGVTPSNADKALVRVGAAVTNEQFRRWAVKNDKWTMPVDVILVEVTWGGVNGPICHGAGRRHQTVNDYVRAVEYIDANGELQIVSDPAHLRAAAGHFGLLGVVTHITFELNKMQYAVLKPIKPDISLAIPPLSREDIPIALRKTFTQAQYDAALDDFEDRATNDYYSEWFWFTRSQQSWVNTWNPVDDKDGVVEYPSPFMTWCQWVEGWLGAVITGNPIFNALPGRWQAEVLATLGMVNLPPFGFDTTDFGQTKVTEIKTAIPNALHFRRGIQNMRVRDLEFQIPIPGRADDPTKPDYSVVRKAWWDIINLTYEDDATPMRLTMELRIMGDSKLLMAPQYGNTHGTACIEVLSIPDAVADAEWVPFLQRVADLWMSYKDAEGKLLNVRPHWAKEWESVKLRGKPAKEYLRTEAYKDRIPEFKATLAEIGKLQGWELKDVQRRFSNELWDYMIYSE